jgi:hypothetical protein
MGIYEKPKPAFMDKLDEYWNKKLGGEGEFKLSESFVSIEDEEEFED